MSAIEIVFQNSNIVYRGGGGLRSIRFDFSWSNTTNMSYPGGLLLLFLLNANLGFCDSRLIECILLAIFSFRSSFV